RSSLVTLLCVVANLSVACTTSFFALRRRLTAALFPYTTLFRSGWMDVAFNLLALPIAITVFLARLFDNSSELIFACASRAVATLDRKSTRLNSSHVSISYAVFCLQKKTHVGAVSSVR